MDLRNLIETHLDLPRLGKDLDELGHPGRAWAIRQWTPTDIALLWDAVRGFRTVTLDGMVPPSLDPLVDVTHQGYGSHPLAAHFERHFCRPKGPVDAPVLFAFDERPFPALRGPRYGVVHAGDDGEVVMEYTATTPHEKPPAWPAVRPSSRALGAWFDVGTADVVRGLSSRVSIGRSKNRQVWLDRWFVLVRQGP